MTRLKTIIDTYKANPGKFDGNVWRCYEACKKVIRGFDTESYQNAIDYVVKELNI